MNRNITADFIHTGNSGFVSNHLIVVDSSGTILEFRKASPEELDACEYYPGILLPGFVNAHCHLELSHLRNEFSSGTRLIPFLKSVVQHRESPVELIQESIQNADREMLLEGIVAVGDISNKTDTFEVKRKSSIQYKTFIEAFDFLQDEKAGYFFEQYKKVYEALGNLPGTMVPHAPYSVSKSLFKRINELNAGSPGVISIHNQESTDEDLLFRYKEGGYPGFWESFGFPMDQFEITGKDSIYYTMEHLDPKHPLLLVHNTCTTAQQVSDAIQWNPNVFFVSCPNANLFIENRMPDYSSLISAGATICIGTDSLSSNWRLSILNEIKTILQYNSWLKLGELLKWATFNGAKALQMDSALGSIESGKRPGINWIQNVRGNENIGIVLSGNAAVKRLI